MIIYMDSDLLASGNKYAEHSVWSGMSLMSDVSIYSKVSSKSLVIMASQYVVKEVIDYTPPAQVKVDKNTLLVVVRSDGRAAYRFNGTWMKRVSKTQFGHEKGCMGVAEKSIYDNLSAHMSDALQMLAFGDFLFRERSILNTAQVVWARWKYTGISIIEATTIAKLWDKKKKPVFSKPEYYWSTERLVNYAVASLFRTKKERRAVLSLMGDQAKWYGYSDHDVIPYVLKCFSIKGVGETEVESFKTLAIGMDPENYVYVMNQILKFKKYLPNKMSVISGGVFFTLPQLVDTNRMLSKMVKEEKALVRGKTISAIHNSTTDVYNRYTFERRGANQNKKLQTFVYSDVFKKLENEDFRLACPSELSSIGRDMGICVGSYVPQVLAGHTAIFVPTNNEIKQLCIEVKNHGAKSSVAQAKGKYNAAACRTNGIDVLLKWMDEKKLDTTSWGSGDVGRYNPELRRVDYDQF